MASYAERHAQAIPLLDMRDMLSSLDDALAPMFTLFS